MTLKPFKKILFIAVLGFTFAVTMNSCKGSEGPTGIQSPRDTPSCASACGKLSSLHCVQGEPIACMPNDPDCNGQGQISCEAFCTKIQDKGVWLNPACPFLQTATSSDVHAPACSELETQCAPHGN